MLADTSIKLEKREKEKLEILQAKLRLEKNVPLDQCQIVENRIYYAIRGFL